MTDCSWLTGCVFFSLYQESTVKTLIGQSIMLIEGKNGKASGFIALNLLKGKINSLGFISSYYSVSFTYGKKCLGSFY